MPALLLFVMPRWLKLRVMPRPAEIVKFVPTVWSRLRRAAVRRAPVRSMMPASCLSLTEPKYFVLPEPPRVERIVSNVGSVRPKICCS